MEMQKKELSLEEEVAASEEEDTEPLVVDNYLLR
jgi:hypothetical protein